MSNFGEQFEAIKAKYEVPDLITEKSKIIFVLESPHKDELKHRPRVPAAGSAGKSMSGWLYGSETPLGILLSEEPNKNKKKFNRVGIMNASPIPLQEGAFKSVLDEKKRKRFLSPYKSLYKIFGDLRGLTGSSEDHEQVRSILVSDLCDRLQGLSDRDITFVLCGDFARSYFQQAQEILGKEFKSVDLKISHPSRPVRNWSTIVEEAASLQELKKWFQEELEKLRSKS